jgi:hypothetical protein
LDLLVNLGVDFYVSLNTKEENLLSYRSFIGDADYIELPTIDRDIAPDAKVIELVDMIYDAIINMRLVYVGCLGGHGRSGVIAALVSQKYFLWDASRSIKHVQCMHLTRKYNRHKPTPQGKQQYAQIRRYHTIRKPLKVLITGDRNSSVDFDAMIRKQFSLLPPDSVVVHGCCKGIDLYAADIATNMGFKTISYPANWDLYGKAAGPIRNKEMLNENPDYILAFHPNIKESKGTKNMITQALKAGYRVWLCTPKYRYEVDITLL